MKAKHLQLFNTPYFTGRNATEAIESLELASNELMQWFSNNEMKANPAKFHLLISSNDELKFCINNVVNSTVYQKLLGLKIDEKLNFITHINMCKNRTKNSALSRITPFMELPKKQL